MVVYNPFHYIKVSTASGPLEKIGGTGQTDRRTECNAQCSPYCELPYMAHGWSNFRRFKKTRYQCLKRLYSHFD